MSRQTILAIDYGTRRLGLAISEPATEIALPFPALVRRNTGWDLAQLEALVAEREVTKIVVGLPIHMNGSPSSESEGARDLAQRLETSTGIEVEMLDERWTTVEAERILRASEPGKRRRQRSRKSGELDSAAATILLRTYLDRSRMQSTMGNPS
ncbi:Holliday junction resolvase RuvX [Myxococcota bacterium]|nr:Holliday junction resolvase RuvX [Myxococcota bacterium]